MQERDDVRDAAALLTTVVTRLCLDVLGSARVRREAYVGPWLPEPVPSAELGPLETVEQREQVHLAALVLLERLTPVERAVTVLRDASDEQVVELTMQVALENQRSRFTTALGIGSQGYAASCPVPQPVP